ncbi:MAG: hypothetical protein OXG33_09950 [Chloroflexi bacterium]|nr:hypothetical protein [Chloroflexota bacterium]
MTVDPAVIPGLLLLAAELAALAAVGYVIVRVVLRQDDERMALAQGLVVGPALWGLIVNFVLYVVPGLAGAAIGWGVMLALGAFLAWRARGRIRMQPRTVAGFTVAALALAWAALASRQQLPLTDPYIHLGLSGWLRAGGFPPEAPWNPGIPLRYHHGVDLLVGLLAPPMGPDPAFVNELLGVYAWVSFVLVVATALVARGSWRIALLLAPLLLSTALWTRGEVENGILQTPIPAGWPQAGLRTSLERMFWPGDQQLLSVKERTLPNISTPAFPLAYALALAVVERAANAGRRSWPATLTLGGLIGFLGLLATSLTPLVLGLWGALEAAQLGRAWRERALAWRALVRPSAGLALAVVLLLAGGGRLSGLLGDSATLGLTFWWDGDPSNWRLLGDIEAHSGGVGLLAVGPVVVAGIAALLAWRDRLVTALAAGAILLAVAGLVLHYEWRPGDLSRFAGNARNLALIALLLALSTRLARLQPRWRRVSAVLLAGLIIWPTVVGQVRSLGSSLGQGIEIANAADEGPAAGGINTSGREVMPAVSARVAAYIRDHTAVDARVLMTVEPSWKVTAVTGRPNHAGFAGAVHQEYKLGPEFLDAREFLEPTAVRRLGIDYVYATDAWAARLPERAARWLADPGLFELLVRDGAVALYRVRPAFLALDVPPTPASFAALRSLPPSTVVYVAPQTPPVHGLLIASALSHTRLSGHIDTGPVHFVTPLPWTVEPLGQREPDLLVLPTVVEPWTWMFPSVGQQPIWQKHYVAIYAPSGSVAPIMPPPARPDPPAFGVRVSDVRAADGRIAFTAAFDNRSPDGWTGQDWAVLAVADSPWTLPLALPSDGRSPAPVAWFDGWLRSSVTTTTHTYEFDARTSRLASLNADGVFTAMASSGAVPGAGDWVLALRLRHEYEPGTWRDAALLPVLRFTTSENGDIAFETFDTLPGS